LLHIACDERGDGYAIDMKRVGARELMWTQACELLERADRLHRMFFRLGQAGRSPVWEPPVDIIDTATELLVCVAIPDVDSEDLEVTLGDSELFLNARRRLPEAASRGTIRQLEIPFGRLQRRIVLPGGRFRLTEQVYRRGCLLIRLVRAGGND
jgi:HSP20 family molecular chaperone IbpA